MSPDQMNWSEWLTGAEPNWFVTLANWMAKIFLYLKSMRRLFISSWW